MFGRKKKTTLQRLTDAAEHIGKAKEELLELSGELLQQGPATLEASEFISGLAMTSAHLQGEVEGVQRYVREQQLSK